MKILVAYDGSMFADAAIEDMRRAGLPEGAEALVVSVGDGGLEPSHGIGLAETDFSDSSRAKLGEINSAARSAAERIQSYFPRWRVSTEVLWGPPAAVILKTSRWWCPDLLVAGSHGRSKVARLFLGSVSAELVQEAACSVRVARRMPGVGPIRVVIGNDGSGEAEAVIREVTLRRWPENTEAHVVSVIQTLAPVATPLEANTYALEPAFTVIREADEQERARLEEAAADSVERLRHAGLTAAATVVEGDPRQVIIEEANRLNADAIFVGARGKGRVERLLLGSVSTHVLTHARCAVEVVRG